MNERIKYNNEHFVHIAHGTDDRIDISFNPDNPEPRLVVMNLRGGQVVLGESDAAALRDCITCFEQTGSFAALLDTSPVPFVGKRMRTCHDNEIRVCFIEENRVLYIEHGWTVTVQREMLRPLAPPAPQYRAFTFEEACDYFKEHGEFETVNNNGMATTITGVMVCGFLLSSTSWVVPFDGALNWTYAGKPLGVRVEPDTE